MKKKENAMGVKPGEIFKNSVDGVNFTTKKIVSGMVVLESQDGRRQILTGAHTLTSTPFYQKKEGEKS